MNDLIRTTARRILKGKDFGGVCEKCGSPVGRAGAMFVIEIEDLEDCWKVVPIDQFYCPHCNEPVITIRIWKTLNVTKEMEILVG